MVDGKTIRKLRKLTESGKEMIKTFRKMEEQWGAEIFWCAIAGVFMWIPVVFRIERVILYVIYDSVANKGNAAGYFTGIFFFALLPLICFFCGVITGWITGKFVLCTARFAEKLGDLLYGGVLYGVFIAVPFAAIAIFVFSQDFVSSCVSLAQGFYSLENITEAFKSLIFTSMALTIIPVAVGIAGGLAGLAMIMLIKIARSVLNRDNTNQLKNS